jgi:hypothetical protein
MRSEGSALLSRLDLTRDENIRDARHELERATDPERLAAWAAKWGRAALERCQAGAQVLGAEHVTPIEERLV